MIIRKNFKSLFLVISLNWSISCDRCKNWIWINNSFEKKKLLFFSSKKTGLFFQLKSSIKIWCKKKITFNLHLFLATALHEYIENSLNQTKNSVPNIWIIKNLDYKMASFWGNFGHNFITARRPWYCAKPVIIRFQNFQERK